MHPWQREVGWWRLNSGWQTFTLTSWWSGKPSPNYFISFSIPKILKLLLSGFYCYTMMNCIPYQMPAAIVNTMWCAKNQKGNEAWTEVLQEDSYHKGLFDISVKNCSFSRQCDKSEILSKICFIHLLPLIIKIHFELHSITPLWKRNKLWNTEVEKRWKYRKQIKIIYSPNNSSHVSRPSSEPKDMLYTFETVAKYNSQFRFPQYL